MRKTVESQNFEISAENDCLEDPFCTQTTSDSLHPEAEHVFKANDLMHRKQLIGTLSIDMHSIAGRIAQSDYQQKLAINIAQKYPNKMTTCKIGCGLKHPNGSIKYCPKYIKMDLQAKLNALTSCRISLCKKCLKIPYHPLNSRKCSDNDCLNCGSTIHNHLLCHQKMVKKENLRLGHENCFDQDIDTDDSYIDLVTQNLEPYELYDVTHEGE